METSYFFDKHYYLWKTGLKTVLKLALRCDYTHGATHPDVL